MRLMCSWLPSTHIPRQLAPPWQKNFHRIRAMRRWLRLHTTHGQHAWFFFCSLTFSFDDEEWSERGGQQQKKMAKQKVRIKRIRNTSFSIIFNFLLWRFRFSICSVPKRSKAFYRLHSFGSPSLGLGQFNQYRPATVRSPQAHSIWPVRCTGAPELS